MRILHIMSSMDWGGAQIRTLGEMTGLQARGHAVTLACPQGAPQGVRALAQGVPVVDLPAGVGLGRDRLSGRLAGWRAVRRLVVGSGCEVVFTHGGVDSWLAVLAAASQRRPPPLVRIHHASSAVPRGPAERWPYQRATRIVTGSEAVRRALLREPGLAAQRIVSVPTGIDLDHFRPGDTGSARQRLGLPDDGLPVLGIVASLRRAKGQHLLLEAVAGLATPARLVVVGDGPQRAALERQADALLPPGRVRFAGRQDDVLPWLQACDVFVLPTLHEGIPQPLAQAMGAGLCCVTTPVGGIPEIATDGESALFVPPGDVAALRAGLDRAIADPALRERLGRGARAAALERCSVQAMLDAMERLCTELVAERGAR